MNYIVISPEFPLNFIEFSVSLKKVGINVLGIGQADYDHLPEVLKGALTEYYRVDSLEDYDAVLKAVAFLTFKYGKIHRLESHNEHWLVQDARLRTDFNIFGLKTEDMGRLKEKTSMKDIFAKANVPYIRGRVVKTGETAREFIREVGYPVVAKPDSGVGAANTYRLNNDEDLDAYLKTKPDVDYIMEEFIQGNIVTFDGLTDRDGKIVFINSFWFKNGIMELVNDGLDNIYYTERDIPSDIIEFGTRVVQEAGLRERFFHLEFFRKADGNLVALELNVRPPGGSNTELFNYEHDFSVYDLYAETVANGHGGEGYRRKYYVAYLGLKDHTRRAHTRDEVINYLGGRLLEHGVPYTMFSAVLGDYYYIFRTEDKTDLLQGIQFVEEEAIR